MVTRIAFLHVRLLLALSAMLFAVSLLLHVSVLMGADEPYARYGLSLFGATVFVAMSLPSFFKDSLRWVDQIKTCPKWMWKTSLGLGLYAMSTPLIQAVFPSGSSDNYMPIVFSGAPLAFDAISFCVLFSVLRGYLGDSQVAKSSRNSVIFIVFVAAIFLAEHAGYLPHPNNYR